MLIKSIGNVYYNAITTSLISVVAREQWEPLNADKKYESARNNIVTQNNRTEIKL